MDKYQTDLTVVTLYRIQLKNSDRVNVVFTSNCRFHAMDWGKSSQVVYKIPDLVNLKKCSAINHLKYMEQRDKVVNEYINKGYVKIQESDLRTWEFWSGMWNIGRKNDI